MGILITLLLGGLAGWLASLLMDRDGQQGILLNIVVGIVGALCCQSGAAMLGYGRQRAVIQTIDADQPLLPMQTIGAPVADLFPRR